MNQRTSAEQQESRAELRAQAISVVFRREIGELPVLRDVSLDIADGEFVCVLGPSGCGKSTLLHVLAGFLRPTSGKVHVGDELVRGPDPKRIFVFQERGVFPWLTVAGNVAFGLHALPSAERGERVARYIRMVGLEGFERSYPQELSGGMKQRLEVARALAVQPDMLFLDEPFSALDSITRLHLRRELLHLWQTERRTVILVTHDIDEAVQLADRIVVLSPRPATVQRIVTVGLEHPRRTMAPEYLRLRAEIARELDVPEAI